MSKRDWKRIISEYETSGMRQSQFCKSRELSLSSFTYYLKRYREAGTFVRVETQERIELELSSGVVLRVSERDLGSILKVLQA